MKFLIPLLALTSFTSISHAQVESEQKLKQMMETVSSKITRGMVFIERNSASAFTEYFNKESEDPISTTQKVKKTVLKIDGSLVYTLEVDEDSSQVSLKDLNNPKWMSYLSEDLQDVYIDYDQDFACLKSYQNVEAYNPESNQTIKSYVQYESFTFLSPACNSKTSFKRVSVTSENGIQTARTTQLEMTHSYCGTPVSDSELKSLDLGQINFCDYRGEEAVCEVKDMSHLTSKL